MGIQVKKIQKKIKMTHYELIKYQLITELLFFKKEVVIPSDIELLTMLGLYGRVELSKFCNMAARKLYKIEKMEEFAIRAQNIRNRLVKLEKRGLVKKINSSKKLIQLTPELEIATKGNLLLEYNFIALDDTKKA